jgi:hypothetical protein
MYCYLYFKVSDCTVCRNLLALYETCIHDCNFTSAAAEHRNVDEDENVTDDDDDDECH